MIQRSLTFRDTIFDSEFLELAINTFLAESGIKDLKQSSHRFDIWIGNETCSHDSLTEFLADYQRDFYYFDIRIREDKHSLKLWFSKDSNYSLFEVEVKAPTNAEIFKILYLFNQNAKRFYVKPLKKQLEREKKLSKERIKNIKPIIFIGHGRDKQWRDLRDHLQDQHHFKVLAYETNVRTGHSIEAILKSMLNKASFAILVFTGEVKVSDGTLQPRPNVIHETGLFQAKLGSNRAIVLLEEGTEDFSNIQSIQLINFSKGHIKEAFGDVVATITREFEKPKASTQDPDA